MADFLNAQDAVAGFRIVYESKTTIHRWFVVTNQTAKDTAATRFIAQRWGTATEGQKFAFANTLYLFFQGRIGWAAQEPTSTECKEHMRDQVRTLLDCICMPRSCDTPEDKLCWTTPNRIYNPAWAETKIAIVESSCTAATKKTTKKARMTLPAGPSLKKKALTKSAKLIASASATQQARAAAISKFVWDRFDTARSKAEAQL